MSRRLQQQCKAPSSIDISNLMKVILRKYSQHTNMKQADAEDLRTGGAPSITLPDTSAALNVEECASQPSSYGRSGFPKQGGQSLSCWLQQVRCDPLLDHRTTEQLPKEADTVIIGSGMTGTSVAKHHLETFPSKRVVVLEAREFCSGATGRDAGHCKPDQC
jgi:hypothetical protein